MHFPLFQSFGKIIAIRLKRPKNQGRTQRNSTTAGHEGDTSILTDLSNSVPAPMPHSSNSSSVHPVSADSKPGLENFFPGSPSAVYPWGASPAREASDIAQVALPLVQAFTGVIPLVGAPMNAAIGGLLGILQVINRCDQNKAALDDLTSRLYGLYCHLCNAPPALDPLERSRRDILARKLEDTSVRLKKLQKHRLAYASVTQAITGCSADIDRYLREFTLSSLMQSQRETHELLIISRRREEDLQNIEQSFAALSVSPLPGSVAPGCVTLVDATGRHQAISVNWCTSYQQLNSMLRVLFERDAVEAQIQRRYIEEGKYDLCIDEGKQVTPLTSHNWSSIEPGTKIVMRVTIQQETSFLSGVDYRCHFCSAVNRLGARSVKYVYRRRTVCSTECRECKRCFQITRSLTNPRKRSSNSDSNHKTDAETLLVRNFHVEQIFWDYYLDKYDYHHEEYWDYYYLKYWLDHWEEQFLRNVRETPGKYHGLGHVVPSHDTYSGIEEIEQDSDQDEEGDGMETDSDEEEEEIYGSDEEEEEEEEEMDGSDEEPW